MSTISAAPVALSEAHQATVARVISSVTTQQALKASVGGSAAISRIESQDEIALMHPSSRALSEIARRFETPQPAALPSELGVFNTGAIVFSGGVPVGGSASLDLHSDGSYTFSGNFHDSGFPSYNADLIWVLVDSHGQAYTFSASGTMHGTVDAGSRDFTWSSADTNAAIAQNWPSLIAGWHYSWTANVNWNVQAALDSLVSALKTAGTIIGAVISIVALAA